MLGIHIRRSLLQYGDICVLYSFFIITVFDDLTSYKPLSVKYHQSPLQNILVRFLSSTFGAAGLGAGAAPPFGPKKDRISGIVGAIEKLNIDQKSSKRKGKLRSLLICTMASKNGTL